MKDVGGRHMLKQQITRARNTSENAAFNYVYPSEVLMHQSSVPGSSPGDSETEHSHQVGTINAMIEYIV